MMSLSYHICNYLMLIPRNNMEIIRFCYSFNNYHLITDRMTYTSFIRV